MSIAGGLHLAFDRIEAVDGTALQIFSHNQRQWRMPALTETATEMFSRAWRRWGTDRPVAVHDSYLVNLVSIDRQVRRRSESSFARELQRTERLGVRWLVTHPGSHGGRGVQRGIELHVRVLDRAIARSGTRRVKVLLETTAGQGTSLGGTFENLGRIVGISDHASRLGVCLDTCHVFAAGYDIRTRDGLERTLERLDRALGLERLQFLHLNDSRDPLGSHRDRHAHIGEGFIGPTGFQAIVQHPVLAGLPGVLETPKDTTLADDRRNLERLRSLTDLAKHVHSSRERTSCRKPSPR